ncbi:MAG: Holliday junction resolvase RuvX [Candidatus Paceibacterota bacterium]|jgi:putative Holliday junction resolvase
MAKILGIDYGAKRIGVAMSDEGGRVAFPFSVVPNDKNALFTLRSLCGEEKIGRIVVGESLNSRGEDNQVMAAARLFVETLAEETALPVSFEQEFLTSVEAHRSSFEEQGKKGRQEVDSSAAALILQRYLDKQK